MQKYTFLGDYFGLGKFTNVMKDELVPDTTDIGATDVVTT